MLYNRKIKKLDFSKYKRFFAFGCSFTNYKWPTWADIIGQEISNYYNYGVSGAGNFYIFHCVMTADTIFNFTSEDLVLIKWSNVHREDRFVDDSYPNSNRHRNENRWLTPGNIYSQGTYSKEFMEYYSDTHCMLRDLSLISCLQGYLQNKNLDFDFLTMVPITGSLDGNDFPLTTTSKNALKSYKKTLMTMPPSIFESVFKNNWHSISPRAQYWAPWDSNYVDNHAHPSEHYQYLMNLYPDTEFKKSTLEYKDYWHKVVLEKHDSYQRPLIDRPMVKHFHSWRDNLDYENNTM